MKIQLLCRFSKKKHANELSEEDKADFIANKIINSSFQDNDSLVLVEYEYSPVVFNIEDILVY